MTLINFVQGNARHSTGNVASSTVTLSSTPVKNNALIMAVGTMNLSGTAATVSSITQTGVSWAVSAEVTKQVVQGSLMLDVEIWFGLVTSDSADKTATVNMINYNISYDTIIMDLCEWSGIRSSSYQDVTASFADSSKTVYRVDSGTTAFTNYKNEVWIAGLFNYDSGSQTQSNPTNGFTLLDGTEDSLCLGYAYKVVNIEGTANVVVSVAHGSSGAPSEVGVICAFIADTSSYTGNSRVDYAKTDITLVENCDEIYSAQAGSTARGFTPVLSKGIVVGYTDAYGDGVKWFFNSNRCAKANLSNADSGVVNGTSTYLSQEKELHYLQLAGYTSAQAGYAKANRSFVEVCFPTSISLVDSAQANNSNVEMCIPASYTDKVDTAKANLSNAGELIQTVTSIIDIELKKLGILIPESASTTFGKITKGATSFGIIGEMVGNPFTLPTAGEVTKISVYTKVYTLGKSEIGPLKLPTSYAKCAIYRESDKVLMGISSEVAISDEGWYDFTLIVPAYLSGGSYILIIWGSNDGILVWSDSGGASYDKVYDYSNGSFPSTLTGYTYLASDKTWSIYATYYPASYPIDILFKKSGISTTDSIDVVFKKLGITKTDSIDVVFKKLGIITTNEPIDVQLKKLGLLVPEPSSTTFGKTGIGAQSGEYSDAMVGSPFTLKTAGEVTKITAYLLPYTVFGTPTYVKCAIYRESDKVLMAMSSEVTITSLTPQWYDFTLITPTYLNGGSYILMMWASSNGAMFYYDFNGPDYIKTYAYTNGSFPNPLNSYDYYANNVTWSIYATYYPASYPIDVLFKKLKISTATDSIDVMFKKFGVTVTDSIDVVLKKYSVIVTDTIDVLFKKLLISITDPIDVVFKKLKITKTDSIDVLIAERLTATESIDVLLHNLSVTKTDSVDVLFKKLGVTKTDSIDVVFKKLGVPKTNIIDVLFKKLGITKTDSIDTLFKKLSLSNTEQIDILLATRLTNTDSIDVLFKKLKVVETDSIDILFQKLGITQTYSIDVLFKKLGVTKTDSIDVMFKKLGVIKTFPIDVLFAERLTTTESIDVLLNELGLTKTDTIDVLFKKLGVTKTYLIDVLTAFRLTTTDSIDVLFKSIGITHTEQIDILLAQRLTSTDSIDVLFKKLNVKVTDSVDVLLKKLGVTQTNFIDVMLKKLKVPKTYSIDTLFKNLGVPKYYSIDSLFKKLDISVTDSIDVMFEKLGVTETVPIDVVLKKGGGISKFYSADVLFKYLGLTRADSVDVLLKKLGITVTNSIDILLKKLGIPKTYLVDVNIASRLTTTELIDALFKKTGITKTYPIDVNIASRLTSTDNVDILLKKLRLTTADFVDVMFKKLAITKTESIDALFQELGLTRTASIDVLFKKLGITKTDSIDVLFKRLGITQVYNLDAIFKKVGISKIDSIDVLFEKLGISKEYSIDVLLKLGILPVIESYSVDVLLKKLEISMTDSVDILFKKLEVSSSYAIDVRFIKNVPISVVYGIDFLLGQNEGRIIPVRNKMLEIVSNACSGLQPQLIHVRSDWKIAVYYLENNYPIVTLRLGPETIPERVYGRQLSSSERGHFSQYSFTLHVWTEKDYQLFDENAEESIAQVRPAYNLADCIMTSLEKYTGDLASGICYFENLYSRESEPERGPQRLTRVIVNGFIIVKRPLV